MNELLDGLVATIAFAGVGLVLLVAGFAMIDLLTPGRLSDHVFVHHRRDPAILLASTLVSLGVIVGTAITTAEEDTLAGLAATAAYGLLGVLLLGLAFVLLDLLTPGKLGDLFADDKDDPAVWVAAAVQLALGLVVAAALT